MIIIDTYDSIFSAYDNGVFDKNLWDGYASSAFPGLKTKVEQDFSRFNEYKDQINAILNDVKMNMEATETHISHLLKSRKSCQIESKANLTLI